MTKSILMVGGALLALGMGSAFAADVQIRDPQNLLGQVEAYLGTPTFAQSYCVGDTAEFEQLGKDCMVMCGPDGCGQMCKQYHPAPVISRKVTQLTPATAAAPATATIELEDGTTQTVAGDAFTKLNGNRVREEMTRYGDAFGIDGYAEATLFQDRPFQTASGETIAAKEIVFDFHPKGHENAPWKVRFSILKGNPGVGQIVRMASYGDWIYQITSVKRGTCAR